MDKAETVFEKIAQRRFGNPKTDIERLMTHYNITEKEAKKLLETKSIKKLLPIRGSDLKNS